METVSMLGDYVSCKKYGIKKAVVIGESPSALYLYVLHPIDYAGRPLSDIFVQRPALVVDKGLVGAYGEAECSRGKHHCEYVSKSETKDFKEGEKKMKQTAKKNKDQDKVIIWRKGNETYAKGVHSGIVTKATCSPEDEYYFVVGASIALARLEYYKLKKQGLPYFPKMVMPNNVPVFIESYKLY